MIVSDAPSCGVTYDRHSDDSRGIIYDRTMFMVQDTEEVVYIFCRWPPVGARPGLDGWRWQGRTTMDNRAAIAISPLPGREIRVGAMTKIRMTWRRNLIYPNKQISQKNALLKLGAMTKVRNAVGLTQFFYILASVFHLVIYLTMKRCHE